MADLDRTAGSLLGIEEPASVVGDPVESVLPDTPAVRAAVDDGVGSVECELGREGGHGTVEVTVRGGGPRGGVAGSRLLQVSEPADSDDGSPDGDDRLEEFAGVLAHDLRNPLTVAMGRAAMLEDAVDESETERVRDLTRALERIETLVEDHLRLVGGGGLVEETSPIDIESVSRAAWQTVDAPAATLTVEGTERVAADRSRFRELLENLFRNAVEHGSTSTTSPARRTAVGDGASDEPSVADALEDALEPSSTSTASHASEDVLEEVDPAVSVTVGTTADGFYVADDGPGIPVAERERVFERGHTGDDSGTGYGLSIVAQIAEAHDWSIEVRESEAGGARFEIATE